MSENQTSFDDLRIALLQSYNEKVSNHINYIITLAIAIFTIFFTKDVFSALLSGILYSLLIIVLVSLFLSLVVQAGVRIFFWSWMGTHVLYVTYEEAKSMKMATTIAGIEKFLLHRFDNLKPKKIEVVFSSSRWSYKHQFFSFLCVLVLMFVISIISANLLHIVPWK